MKWGAVRGEDVGNNCGGVGKDGCMLRKGSSGWRGCAHAEEGARKSERDSLKLSFRLEKSKTLLELPRSVGFVLVVVLMHVFFFVVRFNSLWHVILWTWRSK